MATNFHPHRPPRGLPIMTVGELIDLLVAQDLTAPVLFRSPDKGAFGPGELYAIDGAEKTLIPARITTFPEALAEDEEGKTVVVPAETGILPGWSGVVIW